MEYGFSKGCIVIVSQRNAPKNDLGLPAELSYCAGVNCIDGAEFGQVAFRMSQLIEFGTLGQDLPVSAAGGGYSEAFYYEGTRQQKANGIWYVWLTT